MFVESGAEKNLAPEERNQLNLTINSPSCKEKRVILDRLSGVAPPERDFFRPSDSTNISLLPEQKKKASTSIDAFTFLRETR